MRLKVFKKLFFTTSFVLFVTLTLVFVLLSIAINDEFAKNKYSVLSSCCSIISEELTSGTDAVDDTTVAVLSSLSEAGDIDIFLADRYGRILVCSCDSFAEERNCIHTNTILSSEFINSISTDGKLELSSVDGMYERMNYISTQKVIIDSDNYYIIAVSNVMSATDLIKMMLGMYAISAIFPLLFMFVAEYSVMYRLTRPLKYMSIAAKAVANGDFSKRVPVMSNDEIGELSVLFNRMTDSLSRTEMTGKSFVANVSHELKTPMTTISGFIDGIVDGTIDESRKDYYLKIVSSEVKRLSRLVQSMLSLARLESGENMLKPTRFRLSDTVLNVVISMEQKISENNVNIVGLDTLTETLITGDKDLLHQVIYNLSDNAVKFTPNGGTIEFNLRRLEDKLEFKIKNTGDGIPERDLPHVFERFYKIDKSRSNHKDSLGLGLYICKTVVDLHKGTISVNSLTGEYTEFVVLLPINNMNGDNNERKF